METPCRGRGWAGVVEYKDLKMCSCCWQGVVERSDAEDVRAGGKSEIKFVCLAYTRRERVTALSRCLRQALPSENASMNEESTGL